MVYHYDGLVNKQIKRRFWPGFAARSPFYKRLGRLISAGYLRAVRLPPANGLGSGPSLITLGPGSHPMLKEQLGLTSSDIKRLRHSFVPLLWRHDAAVRDFRLELELACEASGVSISEWVNESELRRHPIKLKLEDPQRNTKTVSIELVP